MERKFGKYAVKNLPTKIIICFALGYLIYGFFPNLTMMLDFSPPDIIYGHQYWRLFTWVLSPASNIDIIAILMLVFYWSFATSIEQGIGTFLFNIYIFGGWFFNTIIGLGLCIYYYFSIGNEGIYYMLFSHAGILMMQFMQYSLFLGFALVYSNSIVLLYFIIPLKASWIAYIDMIFLAYEFITCYRAGMVFGCASIIAYLVNFFVLFLILRKGERRSDMSSAQMRRRRAFKQSMGQDRSRTGKHNSEGSEQIPVGITRHKCAICGRSEQDDPNLEFRFCSKCRGNYEYCNEHLFTHEHIK